MSNPQQTSNTAPNTNDLFWTHELDPRLRPHHLHSRDRHPSSGSSTDGASFHVPFIVACPDHFGSFGSSSSSADAFHDSTATTADTSSGTCIKSKSSKLIKIHTESDEDDLVEATSESSPKATFRMMADEIINCANPNESHTIDPSEYAPLGGRQFVTRSSFLVVIGYFGLIVGSAYMFTLVEQVNEDSFSLFRLQSEFIRMYPHVDGESHFRVSSFKKLIRFRT